ncbi:MAG: tRNA lysidine(34) synthetase TilS [Lachnospiraceae bacterium]|nr:tRNA lysidine(34) synthetase TilS [Lachnospiraceae bacterium]
MKNSLEKKVERFMKEQKLVTAGERVLVGLSGGADSVCLLAVLHELSGRLSITPGAFHVNHGIRGDAADADEAFAKKLCGNMGIPFFAVHEDVPRYAKERRLGLEEAGRELRYLAAERIAREQGYHKLALAHQQNDVAETVLFHLFRGSSVRGLASIPAKREKIIRPLLCCDREEIEAYLKEKGLTFCNDATNAETEYTRNKIRHNILAYAKEQINHGAVRHLAEAAAEFSALSEYLTAEAETLCGKAESIPDGVRIPIALLKEKHRVLQEKVVYCLIGTVAGCEKDITKEHVAEVLSLCHLQSGRQISLPYHLIAGRSYEWIFIKKISAAKEKKEEGRECNIRIPGQYKIGDLGETLSFCCFPYKKSLKIPKNEYTKWFDYDKIRGALCLRPQCTGDRLGMLQGSKTVKSIWNENKVSAEQRKLRLILADEEQVLWIPGVRACDNYRVDETTRTVLEVRMSGGQENGK